MLDSEEYLILAMNAAQEGSNHFAMNYLYSLLENDPDNALAIFLLAAVHAELGLHDRAIAGMKRSIELNPGLDMAYFQLALLYIVNNEEEKALPLWDYLANNAAIESLQLFSKGITQIDKSVDNALLYIDQGIEKIGKDDFLLKSMKAMREKLVQQEQHVNGLPITPKTEVVHDFFMNAYRDSALNSDKLNDKN